MKQRKSGNGTQLDVEYDAMRRITSYNNTKTAVPPNGTQEIAGFEYGYNKEGMRTYENYLPGDSETNQNARAKVFTYDSLYQVTGAKYDVPDPIQEINMPGTQTFSKQVTYQFDNSGNRENVATTPFGQTAANQSYQSNTLNQYTQIDSGVFDYDQVGNMTIGVIYLDDLANPGEKIPTQARFLHDYQNNLIRAEQVLDNRVLGEYVYDALGRRAYKNAWDRETSAYQATYFWYSGAECIEETDISEITIATYTFGIGIDEALCVEHSQASDQYPQTGTYWYHTDVLGSVVALTDNNGAVVERYKYDIYGEATVLAPDGATIRAESMIGNRILYTGREYDKETGLYYYRARYYHAQLGKFISVDPMGMDSLGNLFAYCQNNPINYKDPYGLDLDDDDDWILWGLDWSVLGKEFGHGVWNTASLGTLNEMEAYMQEPGDEGVLSNMGYGIVTAVGNIGNTASLGISDEIWDQGMQGQSFRNGLGSGFSGMYEGTVDAGGNLLPIDEVKIIIDPNTEGWQKAEAVAIGVAKIAMLIALIKGTIYKIKGEPPNAQKTIPPQKPPKIKKYKISDRHDFNKINKNTIPKDSTTVSEPNIDVKGDVRAISEGKGVIGEGGEIKAPSGRIYKTAGKLNDELYPYKGEGFHTLNRGEFKALIILKKYGGPCAKAANELTKGHFDPASVQKAVDIYNLMEGQLKK